MARKPKQSLQSLVIKTANTVLGNPNYTAAQWIDWLTRIATAETVIDEKELVETMIEFYNGIQLENLTELIEESYPASCENLNLQKEIINVTKMFIDQVSVIYKFGVRRDLINVKSTDTSKVDEDEKALWSWIQSSSKFGRKMRDTNKKVNLVENAIVRVWFDNMNENIQLDILTRDQLDVIPRANNQTEAEVIYYGQTNTNYILDSNIVNKIIYHFWTKDEYCRFLGSATEIKNIEINPYGVIPMVNFTRRFPEQGFFVTPPEDLKVVQQNINLKLVELNNMLKFQAFATPVLIGNLDKESSIGIDPSLPIIIPQSMREEQQSSFTYQTPGADFDALKNEIADKIRRFAQTRGFAADDFSVSGSKSSGISLQIQSRALVDMWLNEVEFYEDNEAELFEIIKKVWNYHSQFVDPSHPFYGKKFSDSTRLGVIISDPDLVIDPTVQIDVWEFKLANKLESAISYYIDTYKMTEQEAIDHYTTVQKQLDQYPLAKEVQLPTEKDLDDQIGNDEDKTTDKEDTDE